MTGNQIEKAAFDSVIDTASKRESIGGSATYAIGLDIGSVNVRLRAIDWMGSSVWSDQERITVSPARAVISLFERLASRIPLDSIRAASASGSGRAIFDGQKGWALGSSPFAAINGLIAEAPKTIIQIGGQSAYVVALEGAADKPWRVARSPLCAAGTGRFLEQQAYRLGIDIAEFGPLALQWTKSPPRIAARCSVFAKSDLIHLQQKGQSVPSMLAGLSDSVARMVRSQWREEFVAPIVFVGGVALNAGVVRALEETIKKAVIVPEEPEAREALGAAIIAQRAGDREVEIRLPDERDSSFFFIDRKLARDEKKSSWQPADLAATAKTQGRPVQVYLGVDVGSTSTKAAIIDGSGAVLAKSYLMTAGQPLQAIKSVMRELASVEEAVEVGAVGVTGSGRYLVGNFIGADVVRNEITAQTRAALSIDPKVTTIFEIGGQDSKYVYLENATPLDYQMNKACAAGTGSFVDELSEALGVSTRDGAFAGLAFGADAQLDLGERCAAFMSQAVTSAQQAGISLDVIASSLSTSLAKNYRSKVVGNRRVGERIFLTGAVFYNEAVEAAFRAEYPGKTFIVPEHKEVTGAIGAALLAKEEMASQQNGHAKASEFKGFQAIADSEFELSSFNCRLCENSCAISQMTTSDGRRLYYGSRCDRYDAGFVGGKDQRGTKIETAFNDRERLLWGASNPADTDRAKATGPVVGIPRALTAHDYAPMLTTYLEKLGVEYRVSNPTNKTTIERSVEHAYTDSCFPLKLLHGHVAELLKAEVDFLLIPNAIRLGLKGGEEDQRYACPLVQAAPYIVASAFGVADKLIDPIIDLSLGDTKLIKSFGELAKKLGKTQAEGEAAGKEALSAQRAFESDLTAHGQQLLAEIASDPKTIGVVLLSRAYNAQDQGANLGMATELKKLGVVPIPLDYLPLDTVDPKEVSDRPYWSYERKLLAGAKIIAENPQLYGLFLSNFGCGPNSVIQNIVEDIMGGKPLGQIEIDEHAAEAGFITRIEALVDTIRAYSNSGLSNIGKKERYQRRVPHSIGSGQTVFLPRMSDHADVMAQAMRAFGVDARVLPESDERSLGLSRDVTSGKECLPFRDTLGVFLRMAADGDIPDGSRALMAGSYGPCRLGKYAQEQQKTLDEAGAKITVLTTVSNNAYSDLGLGAAFELLAWKGILATDYLQRLLWMTRPYEKTRGVATELYKSYIRRLGVATIGKRSLEPIMREATRAFIDLRDKSIERRPLIGINGEIYLRANSFCNGDLVRHLEANGLEAEVAPLAEWFRYTAYRSVEDAWNDRSPLRLAKSSIRRAILERLESEEASWVREALHEEEPSTEKLLSASGKYLPARNGSEAVLSLGSGALQLANPRYAGVISVMPHGCMPGGIVAAMAESVSREYGHKPWISLTYDGFADKVNPERIADLAESVRSALR